MKKIITITTILFTLVFLSSCDKETLIPEDKIPVEIKNYVSIHFSSCSIIKAVKEDGKNDEMYEINLSCGFKLEFNQNKEIIDIDGTTKLPDSVVPDTLLIYVASNNPNDYIIGWEIKGSNQYVELNNNVTLIFDMQGGFIRIDD